MLLDPDVVVRADQAAVQTGAMAEIRGAMDVAKSFSGRAKFAQIALLDGDVGAVWALVAGPVCCLASRSRVGRSPSTCSLTQKRLPK